MLSNLLLYLQTYRQHFLMLPKTHYLHNNIITSNQTKTKPTKPKKTSTATITIVLMKAL